jgi:hypothetical protein
LRVGFGRLGIAVFGASSVVWAVAFAQTQEVSKAIEASAEVAVVKRNVAGARDEALQKALSSVNLQLAEKLVPVSVWVDNQDIVVKRLTGDPRPYIQDFRVLQEGSAGGVLRIEVSAVPRAEKLREDLLKWGILYDRARRPVIGVAMLEDRRPGTGTKGNPSPQWTARLVKRLRGLGFLVNEVRERIRPKGAPEADPNDVIVSGIVSPYGDRAVSVQLAASSVKPPAELAKVRGSFPMDEGPDAAAGLIASAFLENLLPAWFRASGEGREYSVGISGLKSYKQYQEIAAIFNSGRDGFASGVERTYASGFVSFSVVYGGSMADLVAVLGKIQVSGGRIQVTDVMGQSVSATIR